MTSAQRALGRAAQATAGGLGATGIAFIDGQTFDVDLTAPGGMRVELREDPPPPVSSEDTDETEGQG
ncbi:hypothetical protein [Streptomyces sp. NE06-03C]|uniref:hypothetical protein n=1 Tax=Streptomyces sp. NE06-03C TaxID=3028694 RepID=UPI0029BE6645|nr:hypothetical protein [Streptomyces sp. NE06-03C]MDX2917286.1 hypothetical protein [Streptomyces sp. NE06-03C]